MDEDEGLLELESTDAGTLAGQLLDIRPGDLHVGSAYSLTRAENSIPRTGHTPRKWGSQSRGSCSLLVAPLQW
jgi:hypothetical protein